MRHGTLTFGTLALSFALACGDSGGETVTDATGTTDAGTTGTTGTTASTTDDPTTTDASTTEQSTGTTDPGTTGSTTDPTGGQVAPLTVEAHFAAPEAAAVASYLISGETEAILVDGQFLSSEAEQVVDLVNNSGKDLKLIWLTHAHPDHYFGLKVLQDAFPDVPIYVTPKVKADYDMIAQGTFDFLKPVLGPAIPDSIVSPQEYAETTITVDGATIEIVEVMMGEHPIASALHLGAEKAFIGGDMLYDRTHLWLTECDPDGWIAQIETWKTQFAGISTFWPGHGAGSRGIDVLGDNKQYIETFVSLMDAVDGADDMEKIANAKQAIVGAYPDYLGVGLLDNIVPGYLECIGKIAP
jgi:glyoxylase-like metal-dependent hydrolase (beta-lactamase superfamily II)